MKTYAILAFVLLVGYSYSYPAGESASSPDVRLVATTEKPADNVNKDADIEEKEDKKKDEVVRPLQLKEMHVDSNVTNRYAHTVISSRYANPARVAQEATFSVILPDTAFITGFVMEIKGKQYKAYVEEKKEAKRVYDQAVASGIGAAHVEVDARDSNRFTVSMNVEAHSKVIFNLTYEQLLVRKHGKYEMVVNLHPGQLVKDLSVDVYINETKPLLKVKAPALRSGNEIVESDEQNEYAKLEILDDDNTCAHIHFAPTVEQQREMAAVLEKDSDKGKKKNGIAGQFVIEYDVERDPSGGQVLVSEDGYFVHFFAPSDLKPIPKHVVFVLDVSGSMHGRKLIQVKQAMQVILGQLTETDYFNLVEFSFGAKVWNLENITDSPRFESESRYNWWRPDDQKPTPNQELPPAFPATPKNIATAKKIIEEMDSNGGTNIYDALSTAVNITNAGIETKNPPRPIIIFLTDGDATDGETDPKKIIEMVDSGNEGGKAALFTLAFGSDANKDFLKKISLKNNGFMRHIYEAADASLQLQDFYKSINSPVLADVKFKYPNIEKDTVTKDNFHTLFDGSELVISGKIEKNEKDGDFKVHAIRWDGPIDFPPEIIKWVPRPTVIGELERLWAYMQIKELLDKAAAKDEKEPAEKKKALDLALKYSFVTPVTSLVVVKPNETKSVETEEAHSADKKLALAYHSSGYRYSSPALGIPVAAADPNYGFAPMSASAFIGGGGGIAGLAGAPYLGSAGFGAAQSATVLHNYAPMSRRISPHLSASLMGRRARVKAYSTVKFDTPQERLLFHPSASLIGPSSGVKAPYPPPPVSTTFVPRPTYRTTTVNAATTLTTTTTTQDHTTESTTHEFLKHLPWLSAFIKGDLITIDDKEYHLGINATVTEEKNCQVDGAEGKCTLLWACSDVYPKLTDLEIYKKDYFCTLESEKYAGVCCVH